MKTLTILGALGVGIVEGMGIGWGAPRSLDDKDWIAAFQRPNATGNATFTGYDISKPYPADGKAWEGPSPWLITLSLAADIPTHVNSSDGIYTTGLELTVQPPQSLQNYTLQRNSSSDNSSGANNSSNPHGINSWELCQEYLIMPGLHGHTDHTGSCEHTLSKKCNQALENQVKDPGQNWCGPGSQFGSVDVPAECKHDFGHDYTFYGVKTAYYAENIMQYAPDLTHKGNYKDYDKYLKQVLVVVTRWAEVDGVSLPGSLTCIKASDVADGSRSAAASLYPRIGSTVAVIAVVAAAVLL